MQRYTIALTVLLVVVGLSGCSSGIGGLLDATVELGSAEVDVKTLMTAADIDCPPLPDPNFPPDGYVCQLLARIEYLLGLITCAEYQVRWWTCFLVY